MCKRSAAFGSAQWGGSEYHGLGTREGDPPLSAFITMRHQYVHKEQIMDRLWPDLDLDKGDRDLKVALNSINKALEPEREPAQSEPRFVKRYGLAYGIDFEHVWLDTEIMERLIATANQYTLEAKPELQRARYLCGC